VQRMSQLIVVFVVILYCSWVYGFMYVNVFPMFKPLYWYIFTIGLALCVAIFRLPFILPKEYSNFIIWIWVYLCYNIFNYLYSHQGDIAEQNFISSIEMSVLLFSFLIIFQINDAARIARLAFVLVVLFSVVMNLIDFISPMWSKVPGRAAGLYENPTISGKMLVLMMVAGIPLVPKKFRLIFTMFVGLGVIVTFSRSSWLLWGLAMIALSSTGYLVFRDKVSSVIVVGFISSLIIFILLMGSMLEYLTAFGIDDYLTSNTLARLGGSGQAFSDVSTQTRVNLVMKSWAVFQNNPWFGAGLGYTRGVWALTHGPHNMYLTMAAEGGVLGLAIFMSLLLILFYMGDNIGKVLTIIYAASSITTHNNLEQPALLVILAFIVVTGRLDSAAV